ncbi:hypothetical protein OHA84_27835 [Streptomyces sp. NBC_00513]|uniref:hypothetical protein n=1 Tax=unclassified Streptomyces TaxID=2593676 RepID=UPI00224FC465|nr:hypothetical protein [Streptomyces sp. NBC_00424]MCX5072674.1 hypothetical protein [Streptomyces sp. NBC_00424]WUD44009.1 hypothetical protein OHA84_27835 [Streptomyces sp. NBC_00513]
MTIYSQHANRGKTQILATYQGLDGVTSKTVTSLGDACLAAPIVDALNRISAFATVPVSVHDLRARRVDYYPRKHLAALTDAAARADLLSGAHSLWYEYVCLRLHQALTDLENTLVAVPDTVSRAIRSELEAEEHELYAALDDFSGTSSGDGPEIERHWEFAHPFVNYQDGTNTLSHETRSQLDRHEAQLTAEDREKAVTNLRVLVTAHSRSGGMWASLDDPSCELFAEPYDSDGFYLTVHAPEPGDVDGLWEIEIGRWEADNPDEEYGEDTSVTGRPVVGCVLPAAPDADAITHLLKSVDEEPLLIARWAKTPVETALVGTTMVVTKRYDS